MLIISRILDHFFDERAKVCVNTFLGVRVLFNVLLSSYVKDSKEMMESYSYGIDFHARRKFGRYEPYPEIPWQSPFGLVLFVRDVSKHIPIAAIGFKKKGTHLFIQQWHEVKGAQGYLRPLKWEILLYHLLILFSHELGIKKVHVYPAFQAVHHNSFGYLENADIFTPRESLALADRLHYLHDVIPQEFGSHWDEDTLTHLLIVS